MPHGEKVTVERFFKESGDELVEITKEEYFDRVRTPDKTYDDAHVD
jgi:hypothetical protein